MNKAFPCMDEYFTIDWIVNVLHKHWDKYRITIRDTRMHSISTERWTYSKVSTIPESKFSIGNRIVTLFFYQFGTVTIWIRKHICCRNFYWRDDIWEWEF